MLLSSVLFTLRHLGVVKFLFRRVVLGIQKCAKSFLSCMAKGGSAVHPDVNPESGAVDGSQFEGQDDEKQLAKESKNHQGQRETPMPSCKEHRALVNLLHTQQEAELEIIAGVSMPIAQVTFHLTQFYIRPCPPSLKIVPGYHGLEYSWTQHLYWSFVCVPKDVQAAEADAAKFMPPI
jgi:hypothetical protein